MEAFFGPLDVTVREIAGGEESTKAGDLDTRLFIELPRQGKSVLEGRPC